MKIKSTFLKTIANSSLDRGLAVLSVQGEQKGPKVWLTAGLHGDEVGGIVVIHEILKKLRKNPLLAGSLYAFPLLNPFGFAVTSRLLPLSDEDLNRSFPGNLSGTLGERLADQIFRTISESEPTLVLDLHNDWTKSVPYTLIDPRPGEFPEANYEQLRALAQSTGFVVVRDATSAPGTLSASLLAKKIPALTLELGESYRVNEHNIEVGTKAVWSILAKLKLVASDQPFVFPYRHAPRTRFLDYSDSTATTSGIIRFQVAPGEIVRRSQIMARIYTPSGRLQATLRAANDGLLLGLADYAAVYPGLPVMSFGVPVKNSTAT